MRTSTLAPRPAGKERMQLGTHEWFSRAVRRYNPKPRTCPSSPKMLAALQWALQARARRSGKAMPPVQVPSAPAGTVRWCTCRAMWAKAATCSSVMEGR